MAMKFRAHETFFIRKGWLSKGMKAVKNEPTAFISFHPHGRDTPGGRHALRLPHDEACGTGHRG